MSVEMIKREEENTSIQAFDSGGATLTPGQVLAQVQQIQGIMRSVFQRDVHYGTIPGCGPKPTLLKPGAEKLGFTFRLAPKVTVQEVDLGDDHRQYHVEVTLVHVLTGKIWGSGVGICSTKESRYRYRWDDTGTPVPSAYWDNRDPALIGGPAYTAKKKGGKWSICRKVEISDPADYWNTCLKIAKKRAHVDAILSATACSDIFTQDVEEMPREAFDPPKQGPPPAPPKPSPKPVPAPRPRPVPAPQAPQYPAPQAPEPDPEHIQDADFSLIEPEPTMAEPPPADAAPDPTPDAAPDAPERKGRKITEKQRRRLYAISMGQETKGRGPDIVSIRLLEWFGDDDTTQIRMGAEYEKIINWVETGDEPEWNED